MGSIRGSARRPALAARGGRRARPGSGAAGRARGEVGRPSESSGRSVSLVRPGGIAHRRRRRGSRLVDALVAVGLGGRLIRLGAARAPRLAPTAARVDARLCAREGGSYIALVTAFIVVSLDGLASTVAWFIPTLGLPLIEWRSHSWLVPGSRPGRLTSRRGASEAPHQQRRARLPDRCLSPQPPGCDPARLRWPVTPPSLGQPEAPEPWQ